MAVLTQAQSIISRRDAARRAGISVWVTAREAFWIALEALRAHKLRSFLTLLGVVIATATLIVVMSVVNGMNLYIATHIANLGANTFVLHQFKWAQGYEEFIKALRRNRPIRMEDYEFLRDNLTGYQAMSALTQLQLSPEARFRGHTIDEVQLTAITPSHADIGREKVQFGRYISEQDNDHRARVCFIGQDIVEKLFPGVDPLDKELWVGGQTFRVIGVAEKVGSTLGISQDNFVFIPINTFRNL
jgi:putative ABC transport system permease protein